VADNRAEADRSGQHQYLDDPAVARLMGTVAALAGEVFVLKALNARLTRALLTGGVLTDRQLAEIGDSAEIQGWLDAEKDEFARALLGPIRDPELARRYGAQVSGGTGSATVAAPMEET
jgi:hypothetical protein